MKDWITRRDGTSEGECVTERFILVDGGRPSVGVGDRENESSPFKEDET